MEALSRILNSALVSTRSEPGRDFFAELSDRMQTPAFRAITLAVRQLAQSEMMSEKDAAEAIVRSFRDMDRLWSEYLFQEGLQQVQRG